jgi:hypothetical protein
MRVDKRVLLAACDADRPDAWRAPHVVAMLRQAAIMLGSDWKVVVMVAKSKWLVTEHAIVSESGEAAPFMDHVM